MGRYIGAAAALLTLAVSVSPAAAQKVSNGLSGHLTDFAVARLAPVLVSEGLTVSPQTAEDGTDFLVVKTPGGQRTVLMAPTVCEAGRCKGLEIVALLPDTKGLDAVNLFNLNHRVVRARKAPNGRILLDRYLVGDAGYAVENLMVEVAIMINAVNQWYQVTGAVEGTQPSVEVSFRPLMEPPAGNVAPSLGFEAAAHEGAPRELYLYAPAGTNAE